MFPDVSRSKLQQDPVSLELENLEETFRTGPKKNDPTHAAGEFQRPLDDLDAYSAYRCVM